MSYEPGQQQVWSQPESSGYREFGNGETCRGADKTALVALAISVFIVFSCIPFVNCLVPFAPLVAGIMALVQAKNAANESRARTYGWIATAIGIGYVIFILAVLFLYGAVIMEAVRQSGV